MKSTWPAVACLALAALIACVYAWLQFSEPDAPRGYAAGGNAAGGDAANESEAAAPRPSAAEPARAAPEVAVEAPTSLPSLADSERAETPRKKLTEEATALVRGRVTRPAGTPADEALEVLVFTRDARAQRLALDTPDHLLESLEGLAARAPVGADGRFEVDAPATGDAWLALRGRYLFLNSALRLGADRSSQELRLEPTVGAWVVGRITLDAGLDAAQVEAEKCELKLQFNALRAVGVSRATTGAQLREYATRPNAALEFEFRGVDTQSDYDLRALPERLAAYKSSRFPLKPGERKLVEAPLGVGGSVRGKIVDEAGRGVAGAELVARVDPEMFGQGGFRVREVKSDENGVFDLAHVPAGDVIVRTSADGYIEATRTFQVASGAAIDGVAIELRRGASIAGRVTWSDGRPAESVEVLVSFDPAALGGMGAFNAMQGAEGDATTDAEGRFEVTGLGKGPFIVRAFAAENGSKIERRDPKAWVARAEHVQPDQRALELVLRAPLSISGRVADKRGDAVAKFRVSAREQTGGPIPGLGGETRNASVDDAEGRFTVEGLTPGTWFVEALAEGYPRSAPVEVLIRADATPEPLQIVLARGGAVSGVVHDPSGQPLAGAEVALKLSMSEVMSNLRANEDGDGADLTFSARSDAQGRFRLSGLEPGQRLIVARRNDWAESEPLAVAIEADEEVDDVVLAVRRGGRILGTVYDASGKPAAGSTLQAQFSSDPLLQLFSQSDARGEFVFAALPPGDWNVIHLPGQSPGAGEDPGADLMSMLSDMKMASALVVDGEDSTVVLGAPPKDPVVIFGVIRHGGQPVAGALVSLIADGAASGGGGMESMKFMQTDGSGRYRTQLRQPGRYVFNVQKLGEGGEQQTVSRALDVPQTSEHEFNIELPGGAIRGRVLDLDGAPAARARITLSIDGPVANATLLGEHYSEITTDSEGRYSLDWLSAGVYTVAAGGAPFGGMFGAGTATSGRQVRDGIAVRDGEVVDGVDFKLRKPGRISGVVRTADGAPAKEASIFLRDERGRPLERFSMIVTDSAGKFVYEGLEPGAYTVTARTSGEVSADSDPVRVRDGEVGDVSLSLSPGTMLLVSLSDKDGELVDCSVEVLDEQGRQVNGMMSLAAVMDAFRKGLFSSKEQRVGPLPPGRYRVLVKTRTGETANKPVTLTGQPERKLNVRL
jgi:hypothetical protein